MRHEELQFVFFECLKIIPLHCAACVNIVFALIISNLIDIITKMFYNPYIRISIFFPIFSAPSNNWRLKR